MPSVLIHPVAPQPGSEEAPYLLGLLEQRGKTIGGGWGAPGAGSVLADGHMRREPRVRLLERPPSQIGDMPPATQNNKKEAMACFHVGHQLGAVGAAFMCAAADQAPGFIDAETGEDMEESLTAEEVKAGILSGK